MGSRNNMFSVMNNSSFGCIKIIKKNTEIIVPKEFITKSGSIYCRISKKIKDKQYEELKSLGIKILLNKE